MVKEGSFEWRIKTKELGYHNQTWSVGLDIPLVLM